MQKSMQAHCAVFRDGPVLARACVDSIGRDLEGSDDIRITDRSLIWNSDLVETLEYDNLIAQAAVTVTGGNRAESRGARARGLPRSRRRQLDEAHAGLGRRGDQKVRLDYRPVHTHTMTNEVKYIEPKARVY